jgi:hypothetical protein
MSEMPATLEKQSGFSRFCVPVVKIFVDARVFILKFENTKSTAQFIMWVELYESWFNINSPENANGTMPLILHIGIFS